MPDKKNTETTKEIKLLTLTQDGTDTTLHVNVPLVLGFLGAVVLFVLLSRWLFSSVFKGFSVSEVTLKDPFSQSSVKIKADKEEKKVAHKIWTELVTRKAAIPFERDKDLIVEVYDSWYVLFGCIREQIAQIPVEKLKGRHKQDVEKLIDIATAVLNDGLRPHLTTWQAHFRKWYDAELEKAKPGVAPQQLQKKFAKYDQLVTEIEAVNGKLIGFADELKNLIRA